MNKLSNFACGSLLAISAYGIILGPAKAQLFSRPATDPKCENMLQKGFSEMIDLNSDIFTKAIMQEALNALKDGTKGISTHTSKTLRVFSTEPGILLMGVTPDCLPYAQQRLGSLPIQHNM